MLLLLNFLQVLFLFTVDRRTIWQRFVYLTELWETGYMVSIERTSDSVNEGLLIKMARKKFQSKR